jgi:hypothetical protein
MIDKPLWIDGCKLCDLFKDHKLITKLLYPTNLEDIDKSMFIIVHTKYFKYPTVVYRDHIDSVLRNDWGKMLYTCKKLFGDRVNLKCNPSKLKEHFHCQIIR